MINKRGQVTIFIIIAIIIVGAVAAFFMLKENVKKDIYTSETTPIANFVQECFDEVLENAIYNIAKQGGYSGYSYPSKESTDSEATYYLLNGENHMPSKARVEKEISEYVNRKFFLCSRHFINFTDYQIEEGNLECSTKILDDHVRLTVDYPLTIKKGESVSRIKDFESEIPVRLMLVYNSVSDFIDQQEETSDKVCLSCLDLAIENNIYVEMESKYNGTVVFTFRDESSELNDEPLEWVFANKY